MAGDHGAGGHVHGDSLSTDEIKNFKIIFIFLNLAVTYLGLLPRVIPECRENESVLSVLNCFSAGIFLAMALMHLFPHMSDAHKNWAMVEGIGEPFPMPYLVAFASYLAMVVIDQVLVAKWHIHNHDDLQAILKRDNAANKKPIESAFGNKVASGDDSVVAQPAADNTSKDNKDDKKLFAGEVTVTKTTALMLVVAISFHAIFEGIAFGLLTEIETAWQLGIGIMLHEITAAIALGTSLSKSGFTLKQMTIILSLFTLLTPLGIIIGMAINEAANAIVDIIFMAISIGTFLYVACGEVIVNEFGNRKNLWGKLIAMLFSGGVTACLWFIESENHTHGPAMDWDEICKRVNIDLSNLDHHDHLLR